jgi:hypothetical protein
MVQGFFFYGIDTVTTGATIGGEYDLVIQVFANETQPALAGVQFAEAGAEVALQATVVQLMPVLGADRERITSAHHSPLLNNG